MAKVKCVMGFIDHQRECDHQRSHAIQAKSKAFLWFVWEIVLYVNSVWPAIIYWQDVNDSHCEQSKWMMKVNYENRSVYCKL